jgi:ribosome-associated toxin RatA of RatAB toxin-antitoxin module
MRHVNRSALVPFSAQQMYDLVEDVEAYPQFLPWCAGAELQEKSVDSLQASIGIGLGAMHTSFTTRNRLMPPGHMSMELLDGPFSTLQGSWNFSQLGDTGCEVQLQVDFEFASRAQDLLFGAGFEKICNELVDALVVRAQALYSDD